MTIDERLFLLNMVDHWTPKEWDEYHDIIAERTLLNPQRVPVEQSYKVGDTRKDECGTWRLVSISEQGNMWELVEVN